MTPSTVPQLTPRPTAMRNVATITAAGGILYAYISGGPGLALIIEIAAAIAYWIQRGDDTAWLHQQQEPLCAGCDGPLDITDPFPPARHLRAVTGPR